MSYAMEQPIAIRASESARAAFIRRTYGNLAGAILAFAILEWGLLQLPNVESIVMGMMQSPIMWLLIIGGFMGVSFLADAWARSEVSRGIQYLGLALYVVAISIVFLPLLYFAANAADRTVIPTAGIMTLAVFGGLTFAVFVTRKDFSYLGPILCIGSWLALGAVVAFAFIGGFTFGMIIAYAMVALLSVSILYHTSNILHHYRTDQHVAAALALFASVATMFYYILYILMQTRD
jgi:FtsH-binding integral membrane protein